MLIRLVQCSGDYRLVKITLVGITVVSVVICDVSIIFK
jgi:hypothetical protein